MFGLFFENCLVFRFWFLQPLLIFYQTICFGWKCLFCQTCILSVNIENPPVEFNRKDWDLIDQVLSVLAPFEEATRDLSNHDASISMTMTHHNNNHWEFGGGKWRPWGHRVEKVPQGINGSKILCCGSLRALHNSKLPGCKIQRSIFPRGWYSFPHKGIGCGKACCSSEERCRVQGKSGCCTPIKLYSSRDTIKVEGS